VILHFAANRSFWDDYEVLRNVNLLSVKEIARLALHRRIPLHFLSSGAARIYEDQAALRLYEKGSSSDKNLPLMPPDDGSDGYVASKWAADRFLRNVAEQFQLPITLHRPVPVPGLGPDPSLAEPETDEMVSQLVGVVRNLGIRPAMNELAGWADTIPMHLTVQKICAVVFEPNDKMALRIVNHPAERRINWSRFIEELTTDAELSGLPSMPTLLWIGEAKRAGFSYFMPSHRLVVVSDSGDMVSRR
jgi:hybrid polyketide synthase/nonribosomal peptide synthetase ACE1